MTTKRYRQCILATCCVPWREDFTFDEALFRAQVRHLIAGGMVRRQMELSSGDDSGDTIIVLMADKNKATVLLVKMIQAVALTPAKLRLSCQLGPMSSFLRHLETLN